MMQNQTLTKKPLAEVGEEIGLELGVKMVNDYQIANPTDVQSFIIGRNIIDQILAQPGCEGIKLYNAYNELEKKTLVYLGVDKNGKPILRYNVVNQEGILINEKGIVADRIRTGDPLPLPPKPLAPGADDWGLSVD